jgi:hypothetical protein
LLWGLKLSGGQQATRAVPLPSTCPLLACGEALKQPQAEIGAYLDREPAPARDVITVPRAIDLVTPLIEQELFDSDPSGKGNA